MAAAPYQMSQMPTCPAHCPGKLPPSTQPVSSASGGDIERPAGLGQRRLLTPGERSLREREAGDEREAAGPDSSSAAAGQPTPRAAWPTRSTDTSSPPGGCRMVRGGEEMRCGHSLLDRWDTARDLPTNVDLVLFPPNIYFSFAEGHFLLPLNRKVIYQHRQRDNAPVTAQPVLPHCEERVDGVRECGDVGANMNCEAAVPPQHVAVESKLPSGAAGNVPGLRVAAKVSRVKPEREAGSAVATDRSPSEDEWDMSSSFVSKAANQIKRKLNIKPKAERKEIEKKKAEKKPEHPVDSTALNDKILELAVQGNSMANTGRYEEAVALFTEAIKHDPKEYRLFGNRSYCYERLQQYSRALSDAHTALTLNPSWPKGYFRKARALAGVKKYAEAIEAFQQVLEIDDSCEDAEFELLQIQTKLMMERGFTQQQCEETLKLCGSQERALEALSSSAQKAGSNHVGSSACLSDGDDKDFVRVKKHSTQNKHKDKAPVPLPAQQPCKLFPIWIGNVTTRISEDSLRVMFESVGAIHSVKMLQDRFCAFINFTTKEGAERAIAELQGMELEGTKLVIRYPDNSYRTLGGATRGGSAH
ncbi:tetratricopeptide repeat protein 31 [Amblyraja radiata]|uniref:tetratricopeptide repeat protein 31 n=1 Tax=Amblyraja radiata TaxID=386614 RepID=UPI001401C3C5|nr:tetratricopeptide repeat protein 31 [Amblyraja radiata]